MQIILNSVGKRYNREWIFKKLSYTFNAGKRYAITGANGSGKSLPNATGIAIYFPSNYLGAPYQDTFFYKENAWGKLLNHFFLR